MTFRRSSGVLDRDISQSFIKPPALITPPSPPSSPPISHPQPQTFSSLAGQHASKEERRNLHTHHLSPHQLTPINNKNHNMQQQDQHPHGLAYLKELIWHSNQNVNGVKRSVSEAALQNKYGKVQEVVGKGAGGVVKLAHKSEGAIEKLFAVKEFRKRAKNESEKDYVKRLVNEYCISSSLHHPHIVETIDLLQDDQRHWVEVMEYCQGGDLYSVIHDHGPLNLSEANCLWKQLIYGVAYLHSMGVAHKDLKPENLVLDSSGCLKITDFGSSEVVKTAFEREAHKSRGVCGSTPYIAPEEWRNVEFDARKADIWSCGIIYFVMIYSRIPWRIATAQDANYRYFLSHRRGKFSPIDKLKKEMSQLLNAILEPDENKRIFISDILENSYFKSLQTCHSCDQHDSFAEFAGSSSSLRSSSPLDSSTIISSTYSDDYESNQGGNYKTIETAKKYNSITKFANEAKKKLGQRGVGKV
ncbi:kinase-like domain-containing protein [Paraphysoderma sedebokerense]|nr:kinase-like domain-containing protein [Paraphysoderma sedebokerense]